MSTRWQEKLDQFDIYGTLIFLPMIVSLLLALQWGGSKYPWGNGRIIALFVIFGVLLIAFIAVQIWKQDNATVPPRLIKQRSVAGACLFIMSLGAAFFIMTYYLPIWFQVGCWTTHPGLTFNLTILGHQRSDCDEVRNNEHPSSIGTCHHIPSFGCCYYFYWLLHSMGHCEQRADVAWCKWSPYPLTHFNLRMRPTLIWLEQAGLLTTFDPSTGSQKWIGYQTMFGFGVGFGMQQALIAVQAVLPARDVPVGTAIVMFCQTLGGALFISVGQNVFTNKSVLESYIRTSDR